MPDLQLDSDVYAYLLGASRARGEAPSETLRRTFELPTPHNGLGQRSTTTPIPMDARHRDLIEFASSPSAQATSVVTKRYLGLLGFLYGQNSADFGKILEISGRHRKYFGRSREELARSGKRVHPRPIPDSPFWAMTNSDTAQKRELIQRVLTVLGYNRPTIERVTRMVTSEGLQ